MQILLVEDDKRICDFIIKGLEEKNYFVCHADNGNKALDLISDNEWDVIILDIMLPDIDGIQLTKMIRHRQNYTPILILSALGEAEDRVGALDSGADDYLTKPFHFNELVSRINALSRRKKMSYHEKENLLECKDLSLDFDRHIVMRAGKELNLSPREFKLLLFLLENKDKVVTRTQILSFVWGMKSDSYTNVVDVYISYLRNKIDTGHNIKLIHTIKGRGYMLSDNK